MGIGRILAVSEPAGIQRKRFGDRHPGEARVNSPWNMDPRVFLITFSVHWRSGPLKSSTSCRFLLARDGTAVPSRWLSVRRYKFPECGPFHTIEFLTKSIGSFFIRRPNSLHSLARGSYLNKGSHDGRRLTEDSREIFGDKRVSRNRTKWEMIY